MLTDELDTPHHRSMGGFLKVAAMARLRAKTSSTQYFGFALNGTKMQPSSLLSDRQRQANLTPHMSQGLTPSGTHTWRMEPGMNIPVHFPGWTGKSQLRPANSAKEAADKHWGTASHKWSSATSRAELP